MVLLKPDERLFSLTEAEGSSVSCLGMKLPIWVLRIIASYRWVILETKEFKRTVPVSSFLEPSTLLDVLFHSILLPTPGERHRAQFISVEQTVISVEYVMEFSGIRSCTEELIQYIDG